LLCQNLQKYEKGHWKIVTGRKGKGKGKTECKNYSFSLVKAPLVTSALKCTWYYIKNIRAADLTVIICRVTILCNKFDGHPKGFAYVEFADKDSVQTAMALDDSLFRGRQIKVPKLHLINTDGKA
jgi:RNA recognition motif-containing protein